MRSSSRALVTAAALLLACASACAWAPRASAQEALPTPRGFGVERFYASAPGAGWLVMDDLDLKGKLGGVIAFTSGYAYKPLRLATSDGSQRVDVVKHEAFADVGAAVTYDRFRVYVNVSGPLVIAGQSGDVGAFHYQGPAVDLGSNPDTVSDVRIGFDARLFGKTDGPFRLGAGAQLFVPSGGVAPGAPPEYVTDDTYRAMIRVLAAGDVGAFTYAAQLGVHIRPLDEPTVPGGPLGSELLFGVAAGPKLSLNGGRAAFVVGPEIYGETAFRSFFRASTTGVEGILSGRIEGTAEQGPNLRVKLGVGGGLDPSFGAPEFRALVAIEVFERSSD
jgi:hypothetical protein